MRTRTRIAALALTLAAATGAALPAHADVLRSHGHERVDSHAFNCFRDADTAYCDSLPAMPAPARFHKPAMACVGDRLSVMCADGRVLWFGRGDSRSGERDRKAYRHYVSTLTARP